MSFFFASNSYRTNQTTKSLPTFLKFAIHKPKQANTPKKSIHPFCLIRVKSVTRAAFFLTLSLINQQKSRGICRQQKAALK
nr:hypothetical protein [uncultured bacterium]